MIGLSPLLVLKARRAALEEFVEDRYDYLGVGVELGDPVIEKNTSTKWMLVSLKK
jgi:hypothetical protein